MLIQSKYRCINCFKELNNEKEKCTCGFDEASYKAESHILKPGTVLQERYSVGRVIDQRQNIIFYVGYDSYLDMKIVIKEFFMDGHTIRDNTISNDVYISGDSNIVETNKSKFANEAKMIARFSNESLVTVFNFFRDNNTVYVVSEFLEGPTLNQYIEEHGTLSEKDIIDIFMPIIWSLNEMHSRCLMHLDVTPDNIMFDNNGKAKIINFCYAREHHIVATWDKDIAPEVYYAPMEVLQTHGKLGPWSDIYSLCATMYRCITGEIPVEVIERILMENELRPANELTDKCSKEFSDILMKGMEIRCEDRYQNMEELADAIRRHIC